MFSVLKWFVYFVLLLNKGRDRICFGVVLVCNREHNGSTANPSRTGKDNEKKKKGFELPEDIESPFQVIFYLVPKWLDFVYTC